MKKKLDWTDGNRITLLENGEQYYARVFEAIAQARHEVLLETFIWLDDKVGRQLQRALLQAAHNGARVHVLVDGWGSPDLGPELLAPLADAGVDVRAYEPMRGLLGRRLNVFRRMHRKLLVVDGAVAFVGGINYSVDHLAEYGAKAKQDYAVEVAGPLVAQVRAFCREALRAPQPHRHVWRWHWRRDRRQRRESVPARGVPAAAALVTRDNEHHTRDIELQYRTALRRARRRVVIANAYFFPGFSLLQDLRRAARRGVRVDLIVQGEPDMAIVRFAASMLYVHLLRAGVRVHEYCTRPFHGKLAAIDDEWATVGSSNLDPLSLALNLEANVVVRDTAFATHVRERLDELIEHGCKQVSLPPPTPLSSAWAQLRGFFLFHFLRGFPSWVQWLPNRVPKVVPLHLRTVPAGPPRGDAAPARPTGEPQRASGTGAESVVDAR
ncbi:MAG TPA: cardiolipin synthase ClsB [Burkholderiaceae bacterium]|nr:cardiolipin synthase ClsB [Burkholderiaceae bacterium]